MMQVDQSFCALVVLNSVNEIVLIYVPQCNRELQRTLKGKNDGKLLEVQALFRNGRTLFIVLSRSQM